MQERRTLVYIDKDDIPASAVEATLNAVGNTLYYPVICPNVNRQDELCLIELKPSEINSYAAINGHKILTYYANNLVTLSNSTSNSSINVSISNISWNFQLIPYWNRARTQYFEAGAMFGYVKVQFLSPTSPEVLVQFTVQDITPHHTYPIYIDNE